MSLSACSKSFVGLPFPSQRAMGGGGGKATVMGIEGAERGKVLLTSGPV